ncbi:MAG: LapA family protein [Siculibacillus sp.]
MMRLLSWLLALPIGIVVVALSVANRKPVTLALDPFRPDSPAFAVSVPLFLLVLGAMILGVVLGGLAVWWRQRIHRRAARERGREAARLEAERAKLAADIAQRDGVVAGLALPAPGARAA